MLLLLGGAAGAGSAFCFLVPAMRFTAVGAMLATAAFVIGYLPWLVVSISAFEESSATTSDGVRARLFSSEDMQRPLVLATKGTVLLVGAPLALVIFFAPYAVYAGVLRPLVCQVVPFLLRVTLCILIHIVCYSYMYVFRPLGTAIQSCGRAIDGALRTALGGIVKCCMFIATGLTAAARATWNKILVPTCQFCYMAGSRCYTHILVPMSQCAAGTGRLLHQWVLQPAWNGLAWGLPKLGRGCTAAAQALYDYVLSPCALAVAGGSVWLFMHVIEPTGRAFGACAMAVGRTIQACVARSVSYLAGALAGGVAKVAGAIFVYVLAPMGRGVACLASTTAGGLAAAASMVFAHVLAPIGRGVACLASRTAGGVAYLASTAAGCLAAAASVVFAYVLAPVGRVVAYLASRTAAGLAALAYAFYTHILTPVGGAVGACSRALWRCTASVAVAAAGAAAAGCCAVARGLAVLAGAGAAAAKAAYRHCFEPVGQAVAACLPAVREAVQEQVLSPMASLLLGLGRAIADGARAAAGPLRELGSWLGSVAGQAWATIREAVLSIARAFSGGR